MIVTLLIIIASTIGAYILYKYKRIHNYYDERGIRYVPGVPVFGNIFNSTVLRRHYVDDLDAVYNAFPDEKYVGFIDGATRTLIIRDPELIRNITVKHFDHFVDRKVMFDPEIEPIFGASLLMLKGDRWRDMRTTLSPAFTSSKMKHMMPFIVNISLNIVNHLKGTLKLEKEEVTLGVIPGDNRLKSDLIAREWSKDELIGQVFVFFIAGFDTTSSVLNITVHELALNPGVQEKLYQEIKEYKNLNKELKFETINSIKYLDCVIHGKIYPGDLLFNSVNGVQMDPKYYPNPEIFDPDRFADDKKHIKPFTYMSFGMGPRSCIGSRFAMLEMKILLYCLISNFKILKCHKTSDPIKLKPHSFSIRVENGSWIQLQARG